MSYPALADIAARARRRIPHFVWEYLDSATGDEAARRRAEAALDAVILHPRVLRPGKPELGVSLMGRDYPLPLGIAPVGMSGLMWPGAEVTLASYAARAGIPYGLSTVAAAAPETLAPHLGGQGWFQLYPPGDADIRQDMLKRAREAGFHTLVLTADVPVASRRERQRRAGITNPMRLSPRILWQIAQRPSWAMAMAATGKPKLRTLEKYADVATARGGTEHIGYLLRTAPDWDYLKTLRQEWGGKLVLKGVLSPADAAEAAGIVDAIWVSGHGGRQFAAGPAPVEMLPAIRRAVGPEMPLIADGGIRSGTDVLRLIAQGADFVMLGRAPHQALAAFGPKGLDHLFHVLRDGMAADMGQLGITRLDQLAGTLAPAEPV